MFNAPVPLPCISVIFVPSALASVPSIQAYPAQRMQNAGGPRNDFLTKRAAPLIFQLLGRRNPRSSGCVDTNPRLREPTPVIVDPAAMVLPDALTISARALTSGYIHRREKRSDSTTAAAADTGIRPATPQRMRHAPRGPPGARHHHRECDLPRRIRPAGLDFQLTMAARTQRLIVLCDAGGLT